MNENIRKSLYESARRLESVKFDYVLIESANLALQGVTITPHDIDFYVNNEAFAKLEEAFFEYDFSPTIRIEHGSKLLLKKKIVLDGVEVEFSTEPDKGWYSHHLKGLKVALVELDDITVKCLPLEIELQVYTELGKTDITSHIEDFLENS